MLIFCKQFSSSVYIVLILLDFYNPYTVYTGFIKKLIAKHFWRFFFIFKTFKNETYNMKKNSLLCVSTDIIQYQFSYKLIGLAGKLVA